MTLHLLRDDLWQARRSLARDRGVAVIVVLVLALGIGATTAIFSLVNSVVLRPLAYRDPDRLFLIREGVNTTRRGAATLPANVRHFLAWRDQTTAFEAMALVDYAAPSLTGFGEPERVDGAKVSAGFFDLLGVRAARGRTFVAGEAEPGRDRVVVVSDAFWRRLGADPAFVGRRLMIDGEALEVVGVLPPDFRFGRIDRFGVAMSSGQAEIFRPWPIEAEARQVGMTGDHNYLALARLKTGVTEVRAGEELDVVQARIAAQLTGDERLTLIAGLRPLHDEMVGASRRGLWMVLVAVGGNLLVACGWCVRRVAGATPPCAPRWARLRRVSRARVSSRASCSPAPAVWPGLCWRWRACACWSNARPPICRVSPKCRSTVARSRSASRSRC
jgi:putative ABC transport system permease protein